MENLKKENEENLRKLSENSYPGRGIILGRSGEGKLLQFYWIMGRSDNSRNRVFVQDKGNVRTQAFDPEKLEDPSLVIYRAMGEANGHFLVSNGDHTESLLEVISAGGTYHQAMRRHNHEPDGPHFTPRIAGGLNLKGGDVMPWLGIIRADPFNPEASLHNFFEYSQLSRGMGWCITTYQGDGNPLPSFQGEPYSLPMPEKDDDLVNWIWKNLNESNRISLALRVIEPDKGTSRITIINKYQ